MLAAMMWAVAVAVSLLVGLTSAPSEKLSTLLWALLFCAGLFAIPTQLFAWINTRKLRRCAAQGLLVAGRIAKARLRGRKGQQIAEVVVEVALPERDQPAHIVASGVPLGFAENQLLPVLFAPRSSAAVLLLPTGIVVGRAR